MKIQVNNFLISRNKRKGNQGEKAPMSLLNSRNLPLFVINLPLLTLPPMGLLSVLAYSVCPGMPLRQL